LRELLVSPGLCLGSFALVVSAAGEGLIAEVPESAGGTSPFVRECPLVAGPG
jgi:hypothetical protein